MSPDELDAQFEMNRSWLSQQPGMQSWKTGCQNLRQKLEDILGPKDVPYRMDHLLRLWKCVSWHWKNAIGMDPIVSKPQEPQEFVAFETVYESILTGQGFGKHVELGGNPIPCVNLAVAYVMKEETAINDFKVGYRNLVIKITRGRFWELVNTDDREEDWWSYFITKLGGFDRKNGRGAKFNSYFGRSHLRKWLGPVIYTCITDYWNFKSGKKVKGDHGEARYPVSFEILDHDIPVFAPPYQKLEIRDEMEKLERVIIYLKTNGLLTKQEKLIIDLFFKDHLSPVKIAEILKIHRGTVSNAIKSIVEKIKKYWDIVD